MEGGLSNYPGSGAGYLPPPSDDFEPERFFDRRPEQAEFEKLIEDLDTSKLLTIWDTPGNGKSMLLGQLGHNCKWKLLPELPYAQVSLAKEKHLDPFQIVIALSSVLREKVRLESFEASNLARLSQDFSAFGPAKVNGTVLLEGAQVSGNQNQIAGAIYNLPNYAGPLSEWNPEREAYARAKCTDAFFEDILRLTRQNSLVVFLDQFDDASMEVRRWIRESFLYRLCFAPAVERSRLLVVIAARQMPNFSSFARPEKARLIKSISRLGQVSEEDFRNILSAHGCPNLNEETLDALYRVFYLEKKTSLRATIAMARIINVDSLNAKSST